MKRRQTVKTHWELWSYDTWGNARDGYQVNDRSCFDRDYVIRAPINVYNAGTAQEFRRVELDDRQVREAFGLSRIKLEIEDTGDGVIYVTRARDGYYIGEMVRIDDDGEDN